MKPGDEVFFRVWSKSLKQFLTLSGTLTWINDGLDSVRVRSQSGEYLTVPLNDVISSSSPQPSEE